MQEKQEKSKEGDADVIKSKDTQAEDQKLRLVNRVGPSRNSSAVSWTFETIASRDSLKLHLLVDFVAVPSFKDGPKRSSNRPVF